MAMAVADAVEVTAAQAPRPEKKQTRKGLNRDVDLFLSACNEALARAMMALPEGKDTEVVVLVAGRASRFGPIARKVQEQMPGRVVHLTNAWARKSFGNTGQIDPSADLKTLTANGAGLFAVLQTNAETSHLVLSFDTQVMDVPVYLQPASNTRPWMICPQLDLREGGSHPLVSLSDSRPPPVAELVVSTSAEEPLARALPADTPLAGDLKLVVEGLSEDRDWAPYVTIAEGTARRQHGRRPRTTQQTHLRTQAKEFVLGPLSVGDDLVFTRLLDTLDLLGSDA